MDRPLRALFTSIRAQLYPTSEGHRVTAIELLYDLVFVYAITNVTGLVEHRPGGRSLLEAVIVLCIVWFGWCAYAWLGNQAKADEGLLRVAMVVAMAGMFFVAISVPYAFDDDSNAAMVLVVAYLVVRAVHVAVYLIAAGDDRRLRSALFGMMGVLAVMVGPLLIGAAATPHNRLWWWLAAVAIDQTGVFFVRSTRWSLNSASHFSERFGLIVIIAIGESIVEVGAAASAPNLGAHSAIGLLCAVAIALCLWWLYFDMVAAVAEAVLTAASGVRRARLARDSYTYIHLPMVAGILAAATGMTLLIEDHEHTDAGRFALYGGLALYLFAHLLLRLRNIGSVNVPRLVVMVLLLGLIPIVGGLPALAQLALAAALLVALVSVEVRVFADQRDLIRHQNPEHTPEMP